jgi:hypothetical protein
MIVFIPSQLRNKFIVIYLSMQITYLWQNDKNRSTILFMWTMTYVKISIGFQILITRMAIPLFFIGLTFKYYWFIVYVQVTPLNLVLMSIRSITHESTSWLGNTTFAWLATPRTLDGTCRVISILNPFHAVRMFAFLINGHDIIVNPYLTKLNWLATNSPASYTPTHQRP